MKRIGHLVTTLSALTVLAGLLLAPTPAAAQGSSANVASLQRVLPYLMLVVDTSGSMERLPACTCTTPGCQECLPNCGLPNDGNGIAPAGKKNRWAVTLEALTGSFKNFECEPLQRTINNGMTYDLGYHLPYFQPWDCTATPAGEGCAFDSASAKLVQDSNGILDEYRERLQFGLMTFDGWDTYVGAPPLVDANVFDKALSRDVQGLWSYGLPQTFHYPNCTTDYMMDTGARSPEAAEGSLISLDSCSDPNDCPSWCEICASTQLSRNNDIQEALLSTRPYGGTPIAASLHDLYHHISKDLSDIDGSCRDRYALLITDGYPDEDYRNFGCDCKETQDMSDPDYCGGPGNDPDAMHCPYPTPEDTARDLVQGRGNDDPQIEKLFVVGLAVGDDAVLDRLNAIAEQGCPELDCPKDADGNTALFADDLDELLSSLSAIFDGIIKTTSRSVPIFASAGSGTSARQYQVNTGFKPPQKSNGPWTGVLERRRFTCDQGAVVPVPIANRDRFHLALNSQTRNLKTAEWDAGFSPEGHLYRGDDAAAACDKDNGCPLVALNKTATVASLANLGLPTDGDAKRQEIMDWMYSTSNSRRAGYAMGDMFHSSPVVVGAPRFDTADEAYNAFRQLPHVANRPQVLYVGSNDGILHAFSMEDYAEPSPGTTTYDEGEEIFGFVPPLLMNDLKQNLVMHQFTMDGTPVAKDVYFERKQDVSAVAEDYHTVLITGMRGGGKAYIALDITDPINPKFLWQFTDPAMGLTYAQPAIGQATYEFDDGIATRTKKGAVAILPGGKGETGLTNVTGDCSSGLTNPSARSSAGATYKTFAELPSTTTAKISHRADVRCWKDQGRALFFVDVETGRLIKKIHMDGTKFVFPSPLVSTPALFQDAVGTLASRAFLMDADGVMWRIDMSAPDQRENDPTGGWTAMPFHDLFHGTDPEAGQLTYEAPILTVDDKGRVVVLVGTGDADDLRNKSAENRVVSLTEVLDPAALGALSPKHYKAALNWEMVVKPEDGGLATSELVTGSMALFNSTLFFGTFIPKDASGTACSVGAGRIHAVHYRDRDTTNRNSGGQVETFGPRLMDVGHDALSSSVINVSVANAEPNFMVLGLNITQRPTCTVTDTQDFNVWNQSLPSVEQLADPEIYLVAQTEGGDVGGLAQERGTSDFKTLEVQLERSSDARSTTSRIVSWATSVD